jgi:hypothetical protein
MANACILFPTKDRDPLTGLFWLNYSTSNHIIAWLHHISALLGFHLQTPGYWPGRSHQEKHFIAFLHALLEDYRSLESIKKI